MAEDQDPAPRQLTLADPVDNATLGKLAELQDTKAQIGIQVVELEQEKIKLLTAAHRLDQQQNAVYEKILIDRGISGSEPIEIDAATGNLRLLRQGADTPPETPPEGDQGNGAAEEDPPPDSPPPPA